MFDLWADQWRRRHARGDVIIVRFADDYVVGFEHRDDAERFLGRSSRQARGVQLGAGRREDAADRVRAVRRRATSRARGLGKPETFEFLGFTHICAKTRNGRFKLKRVTSKKRMRAKLHAVKTELRRRLHLPDPRAGTLARQRPARALQLLRRARQQPGARRVPRPGRCGTGSRRFGAAASAHALTWERMRRLADSMAPDPPHPAPLARRALRRQNPREEPSALDAHAGICAGGRPATAVPTATGFGFSRVGGLRSGS